MTAQSHGELQLVVFVPADRLPGGVDGDLDLWLMPAIRGDVRLGEAPAPEGRVPELVANGEPHRQIDGEFWAGEAQLGLRWVDASRVDLTQSPLAITQTAMGLTFGDGEVRGRAHVSWLLRRGQLDRVTIDTAGLGRDLEVSGANVHEWSRVGDRVEIELKDAASGRVDVDLSWSQSVPNGDEARLDCPRLMPGEAYRTESYMQIARDGEFEVLPELSGWSAVARAELPDWAAAGGEVLGTATATFRRRGRRRELRTPALRAALGSAGRRRRGRLRDRNHRGGPQPG